MVFVKLTCLEIGMVTLVQQRMKLDGPSHGSYLLQCCLPYFTFTYYLYICLQVIYSQLKKKYLNLLAGGHTAQILKISYNLGEKISYYHFEKPNNTQISGTKHTKHDTINRYKPKA